MQLLKNHWIQILTINYKILLNTNIVNQGFIKIGA